MPIINEGGSGGARRAHAAVVYRSASSVAVASGAVFPFDTVDYDTDNFWSQPDVGFKIPAGMAGAYLFNCTFELAWTTAPTLVQGRIDFTPEPNLSTQISTTAPTATAGIWQWVCVAQGQFAVGDIVKAKVVYNDGTVIVSGNNGSFGAVYLGPLT